MAVSTEQTRKRGNRRMAVGVVTSAQKTPKTLRVEVEYRARHRQYGKFLRRRTVLHAHDEKSDAKPGDRVQLMECRPVSKTKSWRLVKILERAPQD